MHSQPPKFPTPLAPLVRGERWIGTYQGGTHCQGDFGNFAKMGIVGKCLLISLIHHKL